MKCVALDYVIRLSKTKDEHLDSGGKVIKEDAFLLNKQRKDRFKEEPKCSALLVYRCAECEAFPPFLFGEEI